MAAIQRWSLILEYFLSMIGQKRKGRKHSCGEDDRGQNVQSNICAGQPDILSKIISFSEERCTSAPSWPPLMVPVTSWCMQKVNDNWFDAQGSSIHSFSCYLSDLISNISVAQVERHYNMSVHENPGKREGETVVNQLGCLPPTHWLCTYITLAFLWG